MINRAILAKTLRDSAALLAACSLGIIAFVVLFVWAMQVMGPSVLNFVSEIRFLRLIMASMGINVDGELSINVLYSVCFTHAMVLVLSWAVVIATSTRCIVGEMEKGTADLLLTLPVSRAEVYLTTSLGWFLAAIVIASCPVAGVWISTFIFETEEAVEVYRYLAPAFNFLGLLIAVGGFACLVSCLVDRRGRAVAIVVGIGVLSVLLNFLEPFISQVRHIRFLGLMNYYRPVDVVRTGEWPIGNTLILVAVGGACWLVGLWLYRKQDIPTA